jgi:putative solute:sodium symporter small subunit
MSVPANRLFDRDRYWRRTVNRILVLLLVWVVAGPIMGVVLVEPLNGVSIGGVPFGFWMAQQGAIYVFVVLIFLNAWLADRTDREFDVFETEPTSGDLPLDH